MLADFPHRVRSIRRLEALEIPDFAVAEHEHTARPEILVEAGKRKTSFLNVVAGNASIEAVGSGENFEVKAQGFGTALKELADRYA
jgi:hypothetical protein